MSDKKTPKEDRPEPTVVQSRHPSERFILYLLTQGDPDRVEDLFIREQLVNHKLPDVGLPLLGRLRARAKHGIPTPFFPSDKFHRLSMDHLRRLHVREMHFPTREVREAASILSDYSIRRYVEMGLLGKVPVYTIAEQMKRKHQVTLTPGGVEAYAHYYWDVSAIGLEEWSSVLDLMPVPYMIREHQMASLQCGQQVALHKMGVQASLESQAMLKDMQRRLYLNFIEADRRMPMGKEKTQVLVSTARASLDIDKRITTSEGELKKLLREFERFRVTSDDERPLSVGQLVDPTTGGSFSDSADAVVTDGQGDDTVH